MSQGQLFKDRFILMLKTYSKDAQVQKELLTLAEIWSQADVVESRIFSGWKNNAYEGRNLIYGAILSIFGFKMNFNEQIEYSLN